MTQINSYNGGAALPGDTVTRDKIKSLTLQHNPTGEGQATDVVYSPLEGKTVPVRNLVIKDWSGNTVGIYDPLANAATEIEIPDDVREPSFDTGHALGTANQDTVVLPTGKTINGGVVQFNVLLGISSDGLGVEYTHPVLKVLVDGTVFGPPMSPIIDESISDERTFGFSFCGELPSGTLSFQYERVSTRTHTVNVRYSILYGVVGGSRGGGGGSGDNDKVAVEKGKTAGYLKDILVSASDMVTLVPNGNRLIVDFNLTLPSDVVRDSAYKHIDAATANPLMDGTAATGISTKYSREDHVHPSDTSREDIANKTTVVLGTSDSKYPTDKAVAEFVNSSIATNTANYISNNGEPFTSVEQLEAYSGTVTNNDYAFVTGTDSEGNTYYDRYKATVSGETVTWALEYRLNNSSFTAAQWSAINSGITSALVSKIHTHSNKDVLDGITSSDIANWNGKQNSLTAGDNITIDGNTISADSQIFYAKYGSSTYDEVRAAYKAGKTVICGNHIIRDVSGDVIVFVKTQINNGNGMIDEYYLKKSNTWEKSGDIICQKKLTFDDEPTAGSNNPVTSKGIKKAIDTVNAKGLTIKKISGEQVICFE